MNNTKILFIHNKTASQRIPFFKKIASDFNIHFVFTHPDKGSSADLGGLDYSFPKSFLGIAFGVIPVLLQNKYSIVVNGEGNGVCGLAEIFIVFCMVKLRRKKYIQWSTGRYKPPQKSLKTELISLFYRLIIPHSNACLVPSLRHKEYMISIGASDQKVFILPNTVDISEFGSAKSSENDIKNELGINGKNIVLFVGRLIEIKGLQYLIPCIEKLKKEGIPVVLLIIGDGEFKETLEKICQDLHITDYVRFLGWISNQALSSYYSICDVFVVPSIVITSLFKKGGLGDTYSLVATEAASFGKPIISSDAVGAAHDIIRNGLNGFVVPQKNTDELYKALKLILTNKNMAIKMGLESRRIFEQGFTYNHMAESFKKAVEYSLVRTSVKFI